MSISTYLKKQHSAREYRFRPLREAIFVGVAIFTVVFSVSYFIYVHALNAQKGEIREGLIRTAKAVSTMIDAEVHRTFVDRSQESSEAYKEFIKPLEKVLATDNSIVFIYTTIMIDDKVYFIVDPTPEGDADGDGVDDKSHIMEEYVDADDSLITALKEQRAVPTEEPYVDKWGSFMSAYVPFYSDDDEFIGVLGIDIEADNYFERLAPMSRATVRAMVAGFFISFMIGALVWFIRNFTAVINRHRLEMVKDYEGLKNTVKKQMPVKEDDYSVGIGNKLK